MLHFGKRDPSELGAAELEGLLKHLALCGRVAALTKNQARYALLSLYQSDIHPCPPPPNANRT
ncbi:MAG: hypothetical protein ACRESZ_15235 [Methylococcales bacterium]